MSVRVKAALLVLVVAVPAFLLSPTLFPPPPGPEPSSTQLTLFLALTALDSLLLGIGIAFVVFGWPLVRRIGSPDSRSRALGLFVAAAWLTISWYPHLGLHSSSFGATYNGILIIDIVFHLPIYVIGLALIWGLAGYLQRLAAPVPGTRPDAPTPGRERTASG